MKGFIKLLICSLSTFVFLNNASIATEHINSDINQFFYIDTASDNYKVVEYNMKKNIVFAAHKYMGNDWKNYWAYKAITDKKDRFYSSIKELTKIVAFCQERVSLSLETELNLRDVYIEISTVYGNIMLQLLEATKCKDKYCKKNVSDWTKTKYANSIFSLINLQIIFDMLYRKIQGRSDDPIKKLYNLSYRSEIKHNKKLYDFLLSKFNNQENELKEYIFHDINCYLNQFLVIRYMWKEGFLEVNRGYPDSVVSTSSELTNVCSCTADGLRSSFNLLDANDKPWLNDYDKDACKSSPNFGFKHIIQCATVLEQKLNIRKYEEQFGVKFENDERRFYDHDYLMFLKRISELHCNINDNKFAKNINPVSEINSICDNLMHEIKSGKIHFYLNPIREIDKETILSIIIRTCCNLDNNRSAGSISLEKFKKLEGVLLKLFVFISERKLTDCDFETLCDITQFVLEHDNIENKFENCLKEIFDYNKKIYGSKNPINSSLRQRILSGLKTYNGTYKSSFIFSKK